jgi:MFS family permease
MSAAAPPASGFPWHPLLATMGMQTLATMAAYSVPALAPAIARDFGIDGALTGYFVSTVYGVGIASSLLAASLIHARGAVRMGQAVLVATLAMLGICASGVLLALPLGAIALGCAYGLTAPVATHLLVPRTPPPVMNLVLSIRQIGVPLGGVLAALAMPPLSLLIGWRWALALQVIPVLALIAWLEVPRRDWDRGHGRAEAGARRVGAAALLRGSADLRRLSFASFVYSGLQLSFVAFTTVHLTSRAGFGLVEAGQALAAYQLAGVTTRPVWGWLADTRVSAKTLLILQGFGMAVAAALAGRFGPGWDWFAVLSVCLLAGATASGYTGLAYAEFARIGGSERTAATGLGSAAMFSGVLTVPSAAAATVTLTGSYAWAYGVAGALAALAAVVLATGRGDVHRTGNA